MRFVLALVLVVGSGSGCTEETPLSGEGMACDSAGDCSGDLTCRGGICLHPCTGDSDCEGSLQKCIEEVCVLDARGGDCGNGEIDAGEACDDGNTNNGDGCNAGCVVEWGYRCTTGDGEASVCAPTCGNGALDLGESCDDGNNIGGDGCNAGCVTEWGYRCTGDAPSVCAPLCGDGFLVGDEECDDDNASDEDGCDSACETESGYSCAGEPSICSAGCGDGQVAGVEECDDNNTTSGDGCDSSCREEAGWTCTGTTPSICDCATGYVPDGPSCVRESFSVVVSGPQSDIPAALVELANGRVAVVGDSVGVFQASRYAALAVELDSAGSLVAARALGSTTASHQNHFYGATVAEGDLTALGVHGATSVSPWAVGFDSSLQRDWHTVTASTSNVKTIISTKVSSVHDGFVMFGYYSSSVQAIRLDTTGGLSWARRYYPGITTISNLEFGALQDVGEDRVYVTGSLASGDGFLLKLNGLQVDGFWSLGDASTETLKGITAATSQQYLVAGRTDAGGNGYRGLVVRVGRTASVAWARVITGTGNQSLNVARELPDASYILAGQTSGTSGDAEPWLVKLDNTGAVEWQTAWHTGGSVGAIDVIDVPGGYVFAAQVVRAGREQDIWIAKVTNAGELTPGGCDDFGAWEPDATSSTVDTLVATEIVADTGGAGSRNGYWDEEIDSYTQSIPNINQVTASSVDFIDLCPAE